MTVNVCHWYFLLITVFSSGALRFWDAGLEINSCEGDALRPGAHRGTWACPTVAIDSMSFWKPGIDVRVVLQQRRGHFAGFTEPHVKSKFWRSLRWTMSPGCIHHINGFCHSFTEKLRTTEGPSLPLLSEFSEFFLRSICQSSPATTFLCSWASLEISSPRPYGSITGKTLPWHDVPWGPWHPLTREYFIFSYFFHSWQVELPPSDYGVLINELEACMIELKTFIEYRRKR